MEVNKSPAAPNTPAVSRPDLEQWSPGSTEGEGTPASSWPPPADLAGEYHDQCCRRTGAAIPAVVRNRQRTIAQRITQWAGNLADGDPLREVAAIIGDDRLDEPYRGNVIAALRNAAARLSAIANQLAKK